MPQNYSPDDTAFKASDDIVFPLLDLPTQLILRVLDFAIICSNEDQPIELDSFKLCLHGPNEEDADICAGRSIPERLEQPAVTRTCRLLRTEALKLYYMKNILSVSRGGRYGYRSLSIWLEQIDYTRYLKMAPVHIRWPSFTDFMEDINCLEEELETVAAPSSIFLRVRRGKVLLGTGPLKWSYQLCFQPQPEGSGDEDGWMSLEDLHNGEIDWNSGRF